MTDRELAQAHDFLEKHDWEPFCFWSDPKRGPSTLLRWCTGCHKLQILGEGDWNNSAAFGVDYPDENMIKLMLSNKIISRMGKDYGSG